MGYKDKKQSLIWQVSTGEFGANWFLKMQLSLLLAYFIKGMFGCEQPFLWGERCVTSQKTAAEETMRLAVNMKYSCNNLARCFDATSKNSHLHV